eukprot:1160865-Pelagomonas_calceolata.AAC.3
MQEASTIGDTRKKVGLPGSLELSSSERVHACLPDHGRVCLPKPSPSHNTLVLLDKNDMPCGDARACRHSPGDAAPAFEVKDTQQMHEHSVAICQRQIQLCA